MTRCGGVTPASSDRELAEPNFTEVPVLNFGINAPWLAASLTAATLPRRGHGSDTSRRREGI